MEGWTASLTWYMRLRDLDLNDPGSHLASELH